MVLEKLRNQSLFKVKETYAAYYGICYTIQKLKAEISQNIPHVIYVPDPLGFSVKGLVSYLNYWTKTVLILRLAYRVIFLFKLHALKKIDLVT